MCIKFQLAFDLKLNESLMSVIVMIVVVFTDVVSIEKTNELFRLIYDVKGRFTVHRITPEEAKVFVI